MDIFSFIYENDNDILSNMKKDDLKELLRLLKLYKIDYRDLLNISDEDTFGTEIEFLAKNRTLVSDRISEYNKGKDLERKWDFKREFSFHDGYEVVSPILKNTKECWASLKEVCDIIKKCDTIITTHAAAHVHIGDQILGDKPKNWINFIKLYIAYENILFRFGYGEYESNRISMSIFACSAAKKLNTFLKDTSPIINISRDKIISNVPLTYKEDAICIRRPSINTIEFRSPNGTLNPIIWQNNINFFIHFLRYATSTDFDYDIINKRRKKQDYFTYSLDNYNKINIKQALELSDLIFDNNLDKINFLRQYLRIFKTINSFEETEKFTR